MDEKNLGRCYRPIYRKLRIGTREYAVLDLDLARERAHVFLDEALVLLDLNKRSNAQFERLTHCLLTATDLGSPDAPYLFALQLLDPHYVIAAFEPYEAIHFLKIAAERGNGHAAYRLATGYAGMARFPEVEECGARYFHSLAPRERGRLAEHYFEIALAQHHQEGIEDMIIAYAYGRGYIPKNAERFVNVCERLVKRRNQAVTLGYGAWLAGMTVEGNEPLAESIQIPEDPPKALDFLLMASREGAFELSQHALHLICLGMINGRWNLKFFSKRLLREAMQQHQLLAFYFAWYCIPLHMRSTVPECIQHYPLTPLAELVEPDEEKAVYYLKAALFGENELIRVEAKALLTQVFGSYYLDVAEELLLQEI